MRSLNLVVCSLLLFSLSRPCGAVDNPLLPESGGYLGRYNGEYYLLCSVSNQIMRSADLSVWTNTSATFQIPLGNKDATISGAGELAYRNGVFHIYPDGLGHVFATDPLGPYTQGSRNSISTTGIQLFQDESGGLINVAHVAGSKNSGEIWAGEYRTPWNTSKKPRRLLDGRRGMWDSLDSADLGDPDLLAYRNNYYLLYAANNPSPRTGLREIGVARYHSLFKMDNEKKIPEPVLMRNAERFARNYETILPTAEYMAWKARYTLKEPAEGWQQLKYKLSGWRTATGGFGFPFEDRGAQLHACKTKWTTDQIWIRREFEVGRATPKRLLLKIRHERAAQVFLNGVKVYESAEPALAYRMVDISAKANAVLQDGDNIIAVHAVADKSSTAYRFIDFGIYDIGGVEVEPTVYALNRPIIVEGPNGLEKWISYRAFWDGKPGAGLDRVFFFDKELYVDGPTTTNTPGYHPPPTQPTFRDLFSQASDFPSGQRWTFAGGQWSFRDGAMVQADRAAPAKAMIKSSPAENYLFEASVRFPEKGKGVAGIVAFSDGDVELLIMLNQERNSWSYRIEPGNSLSGKTYALPRDFHFMEPNPMIQGKVPPFHRLRVTKNAGNFNVMLDEISLTGENPIQTRMFGAGLPGVYCQNSAAAFDGVVYTVGWDEFNEYIAGWRFEEEGFETRADWRLSDEGLEQKKHSGTAMAPKGDRLESYGFTVNARTPELSDRKGEAYGVFPVFIDKDNYLQAVINPHERKLVVTGKSNGVEVGPWEAPLARTVPRRHLYDDGTSYKDIVAWVYALRSESIISGVDVRWLEGEFDYLREEFVVPTDQVHVTFATIRNDDYDVILWNDGRFEDADVPKPLTQEPGILNEIRFRSQEADHVAFGIYDIDTVRIVIDSKTGRFKRYYEPDSYLAPDEEVEYSDDIDFSGEEGRPQEVLVNVELESSYFFRCVKLSDKVIIHLNGEPALTINGNWPPAQVGLVTIEQPCVFNGITLMHYPEPLADKKK
ncbi:MAG: hypothetical protein K9M45_10345 [Kiritimatiellales bacterium]|nr:hypothetical protein [Kiritimatiellales bacterium]